MSDLVRDRWGGTLVARAPSAPRTDQWGGTLVLEAVPSTDPQTEPSTARRVTAAAVGGAIRMAGPIMGAVAGGTVASPTVAGIPAGVLLGGATGGAISAPAARAVENMILGESRRVTHADIATEALAGALPGAAQTASRLANLGRQSVMGAAQGGVIESARQLMAGEPADVGAAALAAGAGAAVGAVLGPLLPPARVLTGRDVREVVPDALPPIFGEAEAMADALEAASRTAVPRPHPQIRPADAPRAGELASPPQAEMPSLTDPLRRGPVDPIPPGHKELGLIRSARRSPEVSDPLAMALEGYYAPTSVKETITAARARIDQLGDLGRAKAEVVAAENPTPVTQAMGLELVRRFQVENRLDDAADVLHAMARTAKTQGQAIQILSTLSRIQPEGTAAYATRILGRKLTEDELIRLKQYHAKLSAALSQETQLARGAEMLDYVHGLVPARWDEKARAAVNISMLLNPKTIIRNIGGNVFMAAADVAGDVVIPLIDGAVGMFTGRRTAVLKPTVFLEYAKGLTQPIRDVRMGFADARRRGEKVIPSLVEGVRTLSTLSKLTAAQKLDLRDIDRSYRTVFSSRVARAIDKVMSVVMSAPDRAFYMARVRASLAQQMAAADAVAPTADMVERAAMEGARAIYQDPNWVSKSLNETRRLLNRVSTLGRSEEFGAGQAIITFSQVPGGLLMRGLEYSPAGFIGAAYEGIAPLFTGRAFDQRKFAQAFSRALMGTGGLAGLGVWMERMGILTGAPHEDREVEQLRRMLGLRPHAINVSALKRMLLTMNFSRRQPTLVGDVIVNYDWAQPLSLPVAMGADYSQRLREGKEQGTPPGVRARAGMVLAALASGVRTLEEQPLLTGLTGFFRRASSGESGVMEAFATSVAELPGQFVPTVARQVQQFMDNRVYETLGTNHMETQYRRVAASLPGVAKALGFPPRYDSFGNEVRRYSDEANTAFNVFINPAFVSRVKGDPALRELYRIWEQTGETQQAPRLVDRVITINGERRTLSANEISDYQQFVGRLTRDFMRYAVASPQFMQLDDDAKAKVVANLLSDINTTARVALFGHRPQTVSPTARRMLDALMAGQRADLVDIARRQSANQP